VDFPTLFASLEDAITSVDSDNPNLPQPLESANPGLETAALQTMEISLCGIELELEEQHQETKSPLYVDATTFVFAKSN
jgi:hypothetical protein